MKVMFWNAPEGNFGDDMNRWIWDLLLPGHKMWTDEVSLIGVGSLLGSSFVHPLGRKLVVGTGSGYGKPPDVSSKEWDIRAVRGPRTAERLGLPRAIGVCDPAAMLARQAEFAGIERGNDVLFVPHWQSAVHPSFDWAAICARAGVAFQSPCADSVSVVRRIAGARVVIAESLHAAIVADAFRVPWHSVRTTAGSFNVFKWSDWTEGLQLPLIVHDLMAPIDIPTQPLGSLRRLLLGRNPCNPRNRHHPPHCMSDGSPPPWSRAKLALWARVLASTMRRTAKLPPQLSRHGILDNQLDRYEEVLAGVLRDYGGSICSPTDGNPFSR